MIAKTNTATVVEKMLNVDSDRRRGGIAENGCRHQDAAETDQSRKNGEIKIDRLLIAWTIMVIRRLLSKRGQVLGAWATFRRL